MDHNPHLPKEKLRVVREGYPYIAGSLFLTSLGFLHSLISGLVFLLLSAFTTFFFRDPPRKIPNDKKVIVSPADGYVVGIETVDNPPLLNKPATKISIFLTLFDVHINRSPLSGWVREILYSPGRKLPAFFRSACENERKLWVIEGEGGITILMTQIAGILARRIVQWVPEGSYVTLGQKIGMIKFGSRTELILPKNVKVIVRKGQRVKAGETIVALLP